jgi:hypothetical protein
MLPATTGISSISSNLSKIGNDSSRRYKLYRMYIYIVENLCRFYASHEFVPRQSYKEITSKATVLKFKVD